MSLPDQSPIQRLSVEEGLDAERLLLERVSAGSLECALLLWRPLDSALVMPRRLSRQADFDAARHECAARGWPVALRDTGGEPVPQSAAVLNIALAYALPVWEDEATRIETAYLRLCKPLQHWLHRLDLCSNLGEVAGAFCDGRYNVNLEHRKLVGTAQRWRRRQSDGRCVVLAHAAVLMENQRQSMVEVVNTFYLQCGIQISCRQDSHVALDEVVAGAWSMAGKLYACYRQHLSRTELTLGP
ncbi:lipoate--protein ligase family protein [Pseudomonas sp. LS1212]|nr:lipoate--protein ligase family protein [Pseudomonas sp. LS1212]UVJ46540.1 lipoate--protein ligase family protein [Pseudomonas sp. LS1212]